MVIKIVIDFDDVYNLVIKLIEYVDIMIGYMFFGLYIFC